MKNINKTLILLGALLFTNIGLAQKGEILFTATSVGNNINVSYELLNEGNVSGVQFDILLPESQLKALNVESCAQIYAGSQLAQCALKGNRLRVIIINDKLTEIETGKLGSINIGNANGYLNEKLKISNVLLFDNKGSEKNIRGVIDYKNISFVDEVLDVNAQNEK